ncbi:1,2-phenylacetyl-CoA epoxidase subunit PaaC [Haloarchaeobius amylolyticus]|uniref:1,2-phenylacetyl-CoA epoxidase subunit PaaC n=1 Tax=Haloarchaeobius amylolyticus TaxID=1198296 RepID=A0ABD6BC96_9EURY
MAAADDATFASTDDLDDEEQEAVQDLLFRLADDELVLAERYTEWQVRAPTLESDISMANIAQDELGHARLWYEVLKDFGYDETDLIWERDADDFRHSTLVEQPFAEGDWADAIVRAYLYDVAEDLQLHALENSTFEPIRDRVGKVLGEEDYHLEYATNWLKRLAADDEGRENVQDAVDRLYPYALTLFEPTDEDVEATIVESGLRGEDLVELRDTWHDRVSDFLESIGIEVPGLDLPDQYDVHISPDELPEHLGRDGDHTEHWESLLDEMTEAYDELGRDYATHIMDDDE